MKQIKKLKSLILLIILFSFAFIILTQASCGKDNTAGLNVAGDTVSASSTATEITGENNITDENNNGTTETVQNSTPGGNPETTETPAASQTNPPDNGGSAGTGEDETSQENPGTETGEVMDPGKMYYEVKSVDIKSNYAQFTQVEVKTIEMNIDKNSGMVDGFIFVSFTELVDQVETQGTNLCVLKGNLDGTADFKTGKIDGHVVGNMKSQSTEFFSGNVKMQIAGEFFENGQLVKFLFVSPVGQVFNCLVIKKG